MSTVIRPEISKNNDYYISKHRYYELKHFCLQYREWKAEYNGIAKKVPDGFDPTSDIGIRLSELSRRIEMVEECAKLVDPVIGNYILRAVVDDRSYVWLKTRADIPCCKGVYYRLYREFFSRLSRVRS